MHEPKWLRAIYLQDGNVFLFIFLSVEANDCNKHKMTQMSA